MKNNLLELNGIDNLDDYNFKWTLEDKVEGIIDFKDKKLLGANVSKEIISHKTINSFEDINNDGIEFFENILILNTKFNISIEYCEESSFGKLNLLSTSFYKTFFTSLSDYDFSNLDNEILVVDFDLVENENILHYYLDIIIGIKEL